MSTQPLLWKNSYIHRYQTKKQQPWNNFVISEVYYWKYILHRVYQTWLPVKVLKSDLIEICRKSTHVHWKFFRLCLNFKTNELLAIKTGKTDDEVLITLNSALGYASLHLACIAVSCCNFLNLLDGCKYKIYIRLISFYHKLKLFCAFLLYLESCLSLQHDNRQREKTSYR